MSHHVPSDQVLTQIPLYCLSEGQQEQWLAVHKNEALQVLQATECFVRLAKPIDPNQPTHLTLAAN
jgi:hypothetical protein